MSVLRSTPARPTVWSASPAPESPPSAAASSACTTPPQARSPLTGRTSADTSAEPRTEQHPAYPDADDLPGPDGISEPPQKVEDIIGEGLDIHHLCKTQAERREKGGKESLPRSALPRSTPSATPTSSPAGSASASGIARALIMNPEAHHRGRVHLGAGRVNSGTGGQPDEGYHPAGDRHGLPVHCA